MPFVQLNWREERRLMLGRIVFVFVLAALPASLSSLTARTAARPDAAETRASLTFSAGKVCSGAIGGTFRDTVNVPDSYKISDCEALAKKLALTVARHSKNFTYAVGCLTADGYSWSETPGQPPNPNPCSW
jgi:hypothetical protein